MKRTLTISALLCAALAAVSCGDTESPSSTQNEDHLAAESTQAITEAQTEPDEQVLYPLPERDMDGFTLRFFNYNDEWLTWAVTALTAEAETGDNIDDEIYRRNTRIKEKYNCEITETLVRSTDDEFRKIVMGGEDLYDIAMLYDDRIAAAYTAGLLESWDVLEYADRERSWWNQDANDVFSLTGEQFAAVGDFTLGMASRGFIFMFNKDLIRNADLDVSIYDMVRNGTWTLDNYTEIAKQFTKDLNGDSVIDEKDQWGAGGAVKQYFGGFITGAGIKYVEIGEDGMPYFTIPGNTRAMNVMESILNQHDGAQIYYLGTESDVHTVCSNTATMFANGQMAFLSTSIKGIDRFRDMESDIGFVPFPKYEETQENYYVLTSGTGVAAIPTTLSPERYENVGILLDAMSRDSQKNLLPAYREVVLKTKYSRDADSADMLDIIFRSGVFDFGLSIWPDVTYYKYMENYLNMKNNFASMTEKQEKVVNKKIQDMLDAIAENNE